MSRSPIATVDLTRLTGTFPHQLLIALGILAVFVIIILLLLKSADPKDGTFAAFLRHTLIGLDNRTSTSRTVAFLWTLTVAYCLLSLVLIALAPHAIFPNQHPGTIPNGWLDAAFHHLDESYLWLLGGAGVAVSAARFVVGSRVASGSLQKANALSPSVADLVSDDQGNLDLVDLQFTLFNAVAIVFVVSQFVQHPAQGIPTVPNALAVLTGLSAGLYTGNKVITSNPPTVQGLLSTGVAPGGLAMLRGSNLVPPGVDPPSVTMTSVDRSVASPNPIPATAVNANVVSFTVPNALPVGTSWSITVLTGAGASAPCPDVLTIASPRQGALGIDLPK